MRYYLATSPVMAAEALNFSEAGVREMYNKLINTVYNVLEFYLMFANQKLEVPAKGGSASGGKSLKSDNVLDKWILAKLQILIRDVTAGMEAYKIVDASRPIVDFVTELSQWYVRRSRDRFKGEDEKDKQFALATLREVLFTLSKVMAPFTPFMAEKIYMALKGEKESVHLEDWPEVNKKMINNKLLEVMELARKTVETALALRAEKGIKVRQPLNKITIYYQLEDGLKQIVADELNVKSVETIKGSEADKNKVVLDTVLTDELKKEGLLREVVRTINQIRKDQKMTIADRVIVKYSTEDVLLKAVFVDFVEEIKKAVLAGFVEEGEAHNDVVIDGINSKIEVIRI